MAAKYMGKSAIFRLLPLCGIQILWSSALADVVPPHAPPRVCEIRQSSWCIYYSDASIAGSHPNSADDMSTWEVRGSYWNEFPLVIQEPRGCRDGLSDTIQLVEFNKQFDWNGQRWIKMTVRLMKSGKCDLALLSPTLTRDPTGSAFFAGLSLIQACETDRCSGEALGTSLRDRVDPIP